MKTNLKFNNIVEHDAYLQSLSLKDLKKMNTHTFQTKLESNVVQFFNIDNLIGKEVIISIIEIPKHNEKKKRKWNYLGSENLNNQMDKINVRDFAYE